MSCYGVDILEDIQRGFKASSKCKAIMNGNTFVGLFGVVPFEEAPNAGAVWMLATPELDKIKKSFLKHAKEELQDLFEGYALLCNQVWSQNKIHIRWLRWMGFQINTEVPLKMGDEDFYYFQKENKDV